jgi:DNA polymerase-3 subunit alpha
MEKLKREKEVVGIYISGHPLDDFKAEMNYFSNSKVSDFKNLDDFINRELSFGGVVSEVQHRTSIKGKGWAIFTVEDYWDSYEFKIFGEEYLRFQHFMVPNAFVFIKAFVKEGWTNKETGSKSDPRLQFNNFQLLHDVMDMYARKLTLQLDINELNEEKIDSLKDILRAHRGDHILHFIVYEMKDMVKLNMTSRKQKVKISQELLDALEGAGVLYKLN